MNWQTIAEHQATVIEELSSLCHDLINTLSQYKNIEEEEQRLQELEERDK